MKKNIFYSLSSWLLFSCSEPSKNISNENYNRKELELKEKELDLRERELKIKENESLITKDEKECDLPTIFKKAKSAVYLIYTLDSFKNLESIGSAFVIDPSGIAISNFHVLKDAYEAFAINEFGDEFIISEIYNYNPEDDYIIFRLNTTKNLSYLEISNHIPEIGEECFAIGNPEGLQNTLSKGIISSFRNNNKHIQTTAEITHGSSGGSLFNKKGEVIGITTSGFKDANLSFALNITEVPYLQHINKNKLHKQTHLSNSDIKNIINRYYSNIETNSYKDLISMYTPILTRFYDNFNIHRDDVIKNAQEYNSKIGLISCNFNVRWNTLEVSKLDNDNSYISYIVDYRLSRKDKNKPSEYVLNIILEINSDHKIQSIYENILEKN